MLGHAELRDLADGPVSELQRAHVAREAPAVASPALHPTRPAPYSARIQPALARAAYIASRLLRQKLRSTHRSSSNKTT